MLLLQHNISGLLVIGNIYNILMLYQHFQIQVLRNFYTK